MTDKVLVPVPGLGVLALEVETYREALVEGARLAAPTPAAPASDEPLLDDVQLGVALNLAPTWIAQAARTGKIPSIKAGRWVRFKRSDVEKALANGKGSA